MFELQSSCKVDTPSSAGPKLENKSQLPREAPEYARVERTEDIFRGHSLPQHRGSLLTGERGENQYKLRARSLWGRMGQPGCRAVPQKYRCRKRTPPALLCGPVHTQTSLLHAQPSGCVIRVWRYRARRPERVRLFPQLAKPAERRHRSARFERERHSLLGTPPRRRGSQGRGVSGAKGAFFNTCLFKGAKELPVASRSPPAPWIAV